MPRRVRRGGEAILEARRRASAEGAGAQQDRSRRQAALLTLARAVEREGGFDASFMSRRDRRRRSRAEAWLAAHRPRAVALSEDQISDAPDAPLAAEITREKLFDRLHQELPYQATVETDAGRSCATARAHRADDLCGARKPAQDRARQGRRDHQGDRREARKEIAELEQKVHLFLFVKVREGGATTRSATADGMEFPKE
jgi:GTP-binding protein Era